MKRTATIVLRLCLSMAACTSVAACTSEPEDQPAAAGTNRAGRGRGMAAHEREAMASSAPQRQQQAEEPTDEQTAPAVVAPAPDEAEEEAEEEKRDFGRELAVAVGDPASCMKPRPATTSPTTLTIALDAVVTETGIVTRGGAQGAQLEPAELECLGARVRSARLRGPIPDAPRTIGTSVTVNFKAPSAMAPAPAP